MKENVIKELYEFCDNFNLSDDEKNELSEYIENLTEMYIDLQKKINKINLVKVAANLEILRSKKNDNKKNT